MYAKEEASQLKQAFWTTFGQYVAPHPSAEGLKINWVNYKTGIKHLYFKMQAENRSAFIGIEMTNPDLELQQMMFEQFSAYKNLLTAALGEEWDWQLHTTDDNGKVISRVVKILPNVSVYQRADWPRLISFFKQRIIALDKFWVDARYGFELFR